MSDVAETAAAAFVALAGDVAGIESAYDHEPGIEGLGQLPCVTMLYLGAKRVGQASSNVEDLEHTWDVFLYLRLSQYEPAQTQMRELVPLLLAAVRVKPTLDIEDCWANLLDELARPEFVHDQEDRPAMLLKRLKFTARKSEP